ncbi:hypothetical protein GQ53DRAFT_239215 [Thozetella sp. PMI_491]|nr:hypothetical protein GQ53DRAFT_239215 [Thozetella sp. PMI_491]
MTTHRPHIISRRWHGQLTGQQMPRPPFDHEICQGILRVPQSQLEGNQGAVGGHYTQSKRTLRWSPIAAVSGRQLLPSFSRPAMLPSSGKPAELIACRAPCALKAAGRSRRKPHAGCSPKLPLPIACSNPIMSRPAGIPWKRTTNISAFSQLGSLQSSAILSRGPPPGANANVARWPHKSINISATRPIIVRPLPKTRL